MDTQEAYNRWAQSYDTVVNKTRDLEQEAAKNFLIDADFSEVIEIGCGTGKNTVWLAEKAKSLLAVDFSEEMMNVARQKINSSHVKFKHADIRHPWHLHKATLISCSLVLEHIEDINVIFEQVSLTLEKGGCFYLCELHPYKQLQASRAKFEHEGKLVQLEYSVHHVADYFQLAQKNELTCTRLEEWFDDNDRNTVPRLISFLFRKNH
jgi:ubiquinone/menaquinone biosynthesis C-methylase UbiE